jgi:hypothetical protein
MAPQPENPTTAPTTRTTRSPLARQRRLARATVAVAAVIAVLAGVLLAWPERSPSGDEPESDLTLAAEPSEDGAAGFPLGDGTDTGGTVEAAGFPVADTPPPGQGGGPSSPPPGPPPGDEDPGSPVGGAGADPCASLRPDASLVVTPDPSVLPLGTTASSLSIANCGEDTVDWTAASKPSISLSPEGGAIDPGERVDLGFSIDTSAFPEDDISFRIKVSEPGANHYVEVSAGKAVIAGTTPTTTPDPGGFVATGSPGCADQCITRAWLTPQAASPALHLEVETDTAAKVAAYVSESAPVTDAEGEPGFPGLEPLAASGGFGTDWTTLLEPLEPATKYHIIVEATDRDGNVARQSGSFTTITPAVDPDTQAIDAGTGCATQCITKAWLTPDADSADVDLEVRTATPAAIAVYVSTEPPTDQDGTPAFPGAQPMADTGDERTTEWQTTLAPLEPGTTYHVIVEATDADGRSAVQAGHFETHGQTPGLLVTFHRIRVTYDGDKGINRGELYFTLGVDDTTVAFTRTKKIQSNTTIDLTDAEGNPGITHSVEEIGEFLPSIGVAGFERDGLTKFCPDATVHRVQYEPGRMDDCNLVWNTAVSGILSADDLDSLQHCSGYGITGDDAVARCLFLQTEPHGNHPRFNVVVAVKLAFG